MKLLPAVFSPTHPTGGLPGYPAIDVFGAPNEAFRLNVRGRVRRVSGRPCAQGGTPGGAYGQSVYVAAVNGDDYFLTHINGLKVTVGSEVTPLTVLGTMCDSKVSGKPGTTHIHLGRKKASRPQPDPPERKYDALGPKGGKINKTGRTIDQLAKQLPGWVKRYGAVTVRHADG